MRGMINLIYHDNQGTANYSCVFVRRDKVVNELLLVSHKDFHHELREIARATREGRKFFRIHRIQTST